MGLIGRLLFPVIYWLGCLLAETGWIPDWAIRFGIKKLLDKESRTFRALAKQAGTPEALNGQFIATILDKPITVKQEAVAANEQHYEVPAEFFARVLGPRKKYSLCDWTGADSLATAETNTLRRFCAFAGVVNGSTVLDLGCGWGSLCLYLVEAFPKCNVFALSNSNGQRQYIEGVYQGLVATKGRAAVGTLTVVTGDIGTVNPEGWTGRFDTVLSVEMFEHMQNYRALFEKLHGWVAPGGRLAVHVFDNAYSTDRFDPSSWIGKHFFTGGAMPSRDLLVHPALIGGLFSVTSRDTLSGEGYRRTADAWLANLYTHKAVVMAALRGSVRAFHRWRIFFLVTSETWGHVSGDWEVSWYLYTKA